MVLNEFLIVLNKLKQRLDTFKTSTGNILINHNDIQAVFDLGSFFKSKKGFGYDIDLCLQYRGIEFKERGVFVPYGNHVITNQREAFEYCKKTLCRNGIHSYKDLNKKLQETYGRNSFIFTDAIIKAIRISINKRLTWGHFIASLERSIIVDFKRAGDEKRVFKFYWHRKAKSKISKLPPLKDIFYALNIEVDKCVIGDYFLIDSYYYHKLEKTIAKLESMVKKSMEVSSC